MNPLQKHKKLHLLLFVICFCNGFYFFGQNNTTENQIWLDFNPSYHFSEKVEYFGNVGYRTNTKTTNWNRVYIKPSVRFNLKNNLQLEGGVGLFYDFGNKNFNRFEIRPWQGARLKWPIYSFVEFKNIARLEERVSFLTKEWESSFNLRFRYKLETKFKFNNSRRFKNLSIPLYAEFFVPLNNQIEEVFSNKFSFGTGFIYKLKKEYQVTFFYNWENSRVNSNDQFTVGTSAIQLKLKKTFH